MKYWNHAFVGLGVFLSLILSNTKVARGELVFEDDLADVETKTTEVAKQETPKVRQPEPQQEVARQEVVKQETVSQATNTEAQADDGRAEALRRQRLREEVKNEDLLTQKLEELRLRDEMKRSEELLGAAKKDEKPEAEAIAVPVTPVAPAGPITNQDLASTPVTPAAPAAATAPAAPATEKSETKTEDEQEETDSNMRITIAPRGGYSSFINNSYDFRPIYAAGVGLGLDLGDHIGIQLGYTYATYSMNLGNTMYAYSGAYGNNQQQLELNDNIFDAGVRANLFGLKSRVRPFVGAGVGYRLGYVNYDNNTIDYMRRLGQQTGDIEVSGFSGYGEAGLELGLSKHIALTGAVRYYNTFTSRQAGGNGSNPIVFQRYNGYYYGGTPNYLNPNQTKNDASRSISQNNFYQAMIGLQFGF